MTVTQPAYNSEKNFFEKKNAFWEFYCKLCYMLLPMILNLDNWSLCSYVATDGLAMLGVTH